MLLFIALVYAGIELRGHFPRGCDFQEGLNAGRFSARY